MNSRETLGASLNLMRPSLPPELVGAAAMQRLDRLAAGLAPIHCAGFEVRLERAGGAVDLVQRISAEGDEPRRLRRFIGESGLSSSPEWARLADFCGAWSRDGSPAQRLVAGIFLAFDTTGAAPTPSLYLSLHPQRETTIEELVELLSTISVTLAPRPVPEHVLERFRQAHRLFAGDAIVTDLGLMLSRGAAAVRVVMAPVTPHAAGALLGRLGWSGSVADLEWVDERAPACPTAPALSIDLADRVLPRIGFEYYPGALPEDLPTWAAGLDRLVDAGMCAAGTRDALLAWPGYTDPAEAGDLWPPSLVVESLTNRPDEFGVLARRLAFVKLVCEPRRRPAAKAYFGFGPRTFVAAGRSDESAGATDSSTGSPDSPAGSTAP